MKRYKHSLSHYKLTTCDMGVLVPVACYEVLPGDTIQQQTSVLLRCSPLIAPVMHPITVRMHHWYVPHRLVYQGWEDFITGGPDGTGSELPYPTMVTPATTGIASGTIGDYMGIPPGVPDLEVSALPARSFSLIFNEYYRDQDVSPLMNLNYEEGPPECAWEKDYFTASRPWPQKGPDVSMPLGVSAPVKSDGLSPLFTNNTDPETAFASQGGSNQIIRNTGAATIGSSYIFGTQTGLEADLTSATAVNVNTVRRAFALQRYQEARAQYGSRYTEYLRYLGVRSSDARLQRPEYLGGAKQTISFSEVLQTAPGSTPGSPVAGGVGQMAGHGIAGMRSRRYRRFFEEHGLVISLMSVRPRTMYTDSLNRLFSRRTKEDYWQRELEQIGQQEVYSREIFARSDASGGNTIFGWNDRYAEYKHIFSEVNSEFRDILNFWHLGRSFASAPVLNDDFVACEPTKRIFQEQNKHSLWCMVNHNIQARRPVRKGAGNRIL